MQVILNKDNYRLCDMSVGSEKIENIHIGKLMFLEIPTSLFKEEIGDNIFLYVSKQKQVIIQDVNNNIEIQISRSTYIELYRYLCRKLSREYHNISPINEFMDYKEFIGLHFNKSLGEILINEKGQVKYLFKGEVMGANWVYISRYSLAHKDKLTEAQSKTIREIIVRGVI